MIEDLKQAAIRVQREIASESVHHIYATLAGTDFRCRERDHERLAKTYALELDTTPVDAEWLDGVMDRDKYRYESCVRWNRDGVCVIAQHDSGNIYGHVAYYGTMIHDNPTRGDVLTALRLFGGER